MKEVRVFVFLDHPNSYMHGDLPVSKLWMQDDALIYTFFPLFFEVSTTYEEIVRTLVQRHRLLPLDDPQLRYNFVLQAFEVYPSPATYHTSSTEASKLFKEVYEICCSHPPRSLSKPVTLREGQVLASTHLTHLVMDKSEIEHVGKTHGLVYFSTYRRLLPTKNLFCATSIDFKALSQPSEKPSSASPNWGQITVGGVLGFLIGQTANIASIIGALDVIERRWREWRTAHDATPQRGIPQVSETDIVAIRLLMTNGSRHTFEEWLTDPDRLKHYIDVFNQPSSSIQPLQASFVQRNGEALRVDVSRGAQNNLQLDELLSYLKIDPAER